MKAARSVAGGVAIALAVTPFAAFAEGEALCRDEEVRLESSRYLRAMSLDLRGRLPTAEEYARMESSGTDALVDAWLASDEFGERMVRHHRDLIWSNLSNVPLLSSKARLTPSANGVLYRADSARAYRGSEVPCLNQPATYTESGQIDSVRGTRTYMRDDMRIVEAVNQEGYVEVEPYWAPGTTVRVCAFDAQVVAASASGTRCDTLAAYGDRACGCGPNLRWCVSPGFEQQVQDALVEDVDRRIKAVILGNEPYTELFTSRRAFVNGPLVHFFRHQTGLPDQVSMEPAPLDVARLPNLNAHAADAWREIELGEEHSGILTSPAYLLRFTTNRARGNRLFDAFMCSPLNPPPGGLVFNQSRPNPDLQRRDGCKYCHANLEPTAAFWGRWAELGAGYLKPSSFPARRADCEACARTGQQCSAECRRFYVMDALTVEEEPYLGMLHAYQFRLDYHVNHVEQGPRLLVLSSVVDSRFSRCVSEKLAQRLMGREVRAEERSWVEELAKGFVSSNYDYKALAKAIVKSDAYRRVR